MKKKIIPAKTNGLKFKQPKQAEDEGSDSIRMAPTKTIRIECETRDYLPLEELEPFQGELKSLSTEDYEKLRKEILETGFAFPIYVWRSPEKVDFILGGHQRVRVLKEMKKEGFRIPQVPIVRIKADSIKQAKRRILQDVSQYGKVERQGLYQFLVDTEIEVKELADSFTIPDFNLDSFKYEFFEELNLVDQVNKGNENSAWVGLPEFETGGKYINLIFQFETEDAREAYCVEKKIQVTNKKNNQWIVKIVQN